MSDAFTTQNVSQNKISKRNISIVLLRAALMMFFNIILPFVLYFILDNYVREIWALLISGIPPLIFTIYKLISKGRVDALGVIIVSSFIVSAIVSLIKDDPRIQLLRKSVITAVFGIVLVISLIPIKFGTFHLRPLAFYFFKDLMTSGSSSRSSPKVNLSGLTEDEPTGERWERYWGSYLYFRRGFTIITAIWGFGCLSEIPLQIIAIFKSSSIDQAFLYVNIIGYVGSAIIGILTFIVARWMKKQYDIITVVDASASDKPPE
jgi:hypothetical protein